MVGELIGGERDVFTAACADQMSGLHGPKGKPCPARPWVCLLCPLAVFAPRHAANLLRLKAFFSRQWQQMPAAQFMAGSARTPSGSTRSWTDSTRSCWRMLPRLSVTMTTSCRCGPRRRHDDHPARAHLVILAFEIGLVAPTR
ncbi:hypothetical protein ACPXCE_17270 [Streptomyces sp. DT24]|uniref:hypothetical protein n=1 Tax=Streptomyces sp. DT24 TaxID=3416520 RepID=UPI003CE76002